MNGASPALSSGHCNAVKGHTSTRITNHPSSTSVSPRPHHHTFYRQVQSNFRFLGLTYFSHCPSHRICDKKTNFHVFFQPSFTFSYYGRVGPQRFRLMQRTALLRPQPITTSRSLNDLSDLPQCLERRQLQLSTSTLSSDGSSSEGGPDRGATVRLLWLSMMRVK